MRGHRRCSERGNWFSTVILVFFSALVIVPAGFVADASTTSSSPSSSSSSSSKGAIIGIDLGTTYSCVAVARNGQVEIIANDQGNRVTPSYVAWGERDRLVGDAAKNQAAMNPHNTVFDVKRLIGRKFSDQTVQNDKTLFPFSVVNQDGRPYVEVDVHGEMKRFAPEEVSSMVISKMKKTAEDYLGKEVTHAVITVPAYFNDAQRQATKDAGAIAGLVVERIINEPTAAAVAFGVDQVPSGKESNVLVFDLGGGTFDTTLLTIDGGVFEVLATNGDTHLGGEDFDQRVMKYFVNMIMKKDGVDISSDNRALQKLRREVERVKRVLSKDTVARLEIDSLYSGMDFSESLTRTRFEELNADLFRRTLDPVKKVLDSAGLTVSEVDTVVLVGGSTRIPKVRSLLKDFFNGKEPSTGINPDEAVAFGAAFQGALLSDDESCYVGGQGDMVVLDIVSLSKGIETVGGVMTPIIPSGTTIPTSKTKAFSTYQDNQSSVLIQVFEGQRAMVKDNTRLGGFDLTGIPPAPRGVPQIEVTFKIDVDGILSVTASDKGTGRSEVLTVTPEAGRLSKTDIEAMKKDAAQFEEEDVRILGQIEARNGLESYLYGLRNSVNSPMNSDGTSSGLGDMMNPDEKDDIEAAIEIALDWLEDAPPGTDADEFNDRRKEVEAVATPIIRRVYEKGESGNDDFDFDTDEL